MEVTARHLAAGGRFDHTWTFNITFLAVGLSGGKSAINNRPTLSWHVEEGTTTEEKRIKATPSDGDKAKSMGRDLAGDWEVATKLFAHLNKQHWALLNPNR